MAEALALGVFPNLSEEELKKMVNAMSGEVTERESPIPEATNEETLKLISAIDPEEKESFRELIKETLDKLSVQEKKSG